MVRFSLTILLSFLCSVSIYACSWIPWSFCHTCSARPSNSVISGVIIDTIPNAIRLLVIDVFRGNEQRDTITIWDGTDFDCNGLFPMDAKGLGLGLYQGDTTIIGDSIIVVMPKIGSLENTWDVPGDYRRPDYFGYEPNLYIQNDTVRGYISGLWSVFDRSLLRMDYTAFKSHWFANNMECSDLVSVEEKSVVVKVYPVAVSDKLMIETNAVTYSITVFSGNGVKLIEKTNSDEGFIDMSNFNTGLYLVELKTKGGFLRKKIVKL